MDPGAPQRRPLTSLVSETESQAEQRCRPPRQPRGPAGPVRRHTRHREPCRRRPLQPSGDSRISAGCPIR